MFLTKYRPNSALDSFFGDFLPFYNEGRGREGFRMPMTNINESDAAFTLTMEMPGVEKKNIDVAVENDQIVITGEKTEKTESEGLLRREIRSETFRRSFVLDSVIDRENIKAKLENGVLKVTLPKTAEKTGRKVNID